MPKVEAAKADGRWAIAYASQRNAIVPADLAAVLAVSPPTAQAFEALGKTQQYAVILNRGRAAAGPWPKRTRWSVQWTAVG